MILDPTLFVQGRLRGPGALGCLFLSLPWIPVSLWAQSELETEQALEQEQTWLKDEPIPLLESYRTETWLNQERGGGIDPQGIGLERWRKSLDSMPWTENQKNTAYQRLRQPNAQKCNPWYWMGLPWMDTVTARIWAGFFAPCSLFGTSGRATSQNFTKFEAVSGWLWDCNTLKAETPWQHSLLQYRVNQQTDELRWALGWEYRPNDRILESFGGYFDGNNAKNRWILGDFHLQSANLLFFQTVSLPAFVQPWHHPPGSEIPRPSVRWSSGTQVRGLSLQRITPWGRWIWSGYIPKSQTTHPFMQSLTFERHKGRLEQSWQAALLQNHWRIGGNLAWHGLNYRIQWNGLWSPTQEEHSARLGRLWTLILTPHPRWSFGIRHRTSFHTNDPSKSFPESKTRPEPDSVSMMNAVWQMKPYWNLAFRIEKNTIGLEAASSKGPLQNFRYLLLFNQASKNNPRPTLRQYLRLPWTNGPTKSGEVQVGFSQSWVKSEHTRHSLVLAHQVLWRLKGPSNLKVRLGQTWIIAGPEGETIMVQEDQRFGNTWWRGSSTQWRLTASLQGRSKGISWRLWARRVQDENGSRWECSLRLTQRWTDESYH